MGDPISTPVQTGATEPRSNRAKWQVFCSITTAYSVFYVCRLGLSVTKKPLIDEGVLDASQIGVVGAALYFAYAIGKLVNGIIADHVNIKRFLIAGLLACSLISLGVGKGSTYAVFVLLWGAQGWFQSFGAPACVVSLAHWFDSRERGTYYAIWSASHNIGEALTFVLTAAIVSAFGWVWGFRAAGILGLVMCCLLGIFHRDRPRPEIRAKAVRSLQWQVVKNPAVWLVALASALMYVTRYSINSWGMFYLQEAKGYCAVQAGSLVGLSAISGIFGTLFCGYFSDRYFEGRRAMPSVIFTCVLAGAMALLVFSPHYAIIDQASLVLAGFAVGALVVYLGGLMAVDLSSKQAAGMALGLVGIASYAGAGLQDMVSGLLIEKGRSTIGGTIHYDFSLVRWIWVGAPVLSCLVTLFIWQRARQSRLTR